MAAALKSKTGSHHRADGAAEAAREHGGEGGWAHHPAAMGEPRKPLEVDDAEESTEDAEKAAQRHPETGRFVESPRHPYLTDGQAADSPGNMPATPRPADIWPGMSEHPLAGPLAAPERLSEVHTEQASAHPEASVNEPGTAVLYHLDYASGGPVHPEARPIQDGFHIAQQGADS